MTGISWKLIDSAPKDGRVILLFDPAQLTPEHTIKLGVWLEGFEARWDREMNWIPGCRGRWHGLWTPSKVWNPSHWAEANEPTSGWK